MHELGLVNYVVKEVSKVAEENNVSRIKSVTLEFGEVSGIVTSYLYDYWNWYTKKYPVFEGSELKCEEIPAVTWCDNCKITYSTITYGKTCPHCGSGNTWLLRGNEMRIKQVEVYDEEEEGSGTLEAKGEYIP
ncbi:MAG: hydrogenase maturation nickel metallochaperone HypA [Mogibacterium sp.]|jgi:hydrogenase nickel incorporation protein HypA/HybF|nr:hydrogenase maturation nickel metallochaperone HypA [Mogibacterium sp.]MBR3377066.1 hydrogenase maturation nickel metallochaperone HypA [Mogibacterium sp.]